MKKVIMFRSRSTGRLVCCISDPASADFMRLNNGSSLRPEIPGRSIKKGGAWNLRSGDVTANIIPRSIARREAVIEIRSRSRMTGRGNQSDDPRAFMRTGAALTDGADKMRATLYAVPSWHGKGTSKRVPTKTGTTRPLTQKESTDRLYSVYGKGGFQKNYSGLKDDIRDLQKSKAPRNLKRKVVEDYKNKAELVRYPKPRP